ncbi:MAG: T9SS type A sorting domain-containing protein [Ignavibacteria bacterium]
MILHIVGNNGVILKSTSSGNNWIPINSNVSSDLLNISNDYYYVTGENGAVLRINNNSVVNYNSGSSEDLCGVNDYNIYSPVFCGANGTVLIGTEFSPISSNTISKLNSVIKTSNSKCFIVGDNGLILYTNILVSNYYSALNSNNINTYFQNNGVFNSIQNSESGGFEWPKNENKFARYSSGIILGAIVNTDTLVTVSVYDSEFLPGFTDVNGVPSGNNSNEYQIYKLTHGISDSDRMNWPNKLLGNSDQGAPVYFDSLAMSYKPVDFGNQSMFYSYTDSYPISHHNNAGSTAPLKADIKQINYSFNQPEELKNIVYQEYRIINRSSQVWNNAYINLFSDDDVGETQNDAVGTDTNLRLTYSYNFTSNDFIYSSNPPAVGFLVIRAPLLNTGNNNDTVYYYEGKNKRIKIGYKEDRISSSVIYHDDSFQPRNYTETYNAIRGFKNNGTSYVNPSTSQITKFVYSGDPVTNTGWLCPNSGDMRFYTGFGPMNINPGDTQVIVIAQVIGQGTDRLSSISKLRESSADAQEFYDNCFSDVVISVNNISQYIPNTFILNQNYPNPFNPKTVISYEIQMTGYRQVSLKIYNAIGKEVAVLVNEKQSSGKYSVEFHGEDFASGVYFYKLEAGDFSETKRMVLIK